MLITKMLSRVAVAIGRFEGGFGGNFGCNETALLVHAWLPSG
jgi:hypothetical protein